MSLFQKSVEKKYLNDLDTALIDKKYADFLKHFGNPEIQENIRNSKEEQYQGEFLIDLFVNILGYTKNPTPKFNLTTELKNISNSKKADGAILKGDDAIAVIELKGTDTTDLDKIETQAFGYKNHHPKCKYVITSNFEKLRFYIQNAVDHVDFDLFNLTREQFYLLWLCLAKDNLLTDLPLKIKESSVLQEENITKKLYADYSKFREAIYNNLVKKNPETDKLLLFKKTQKLLDRFLFIFFAEDRLLLPPNSISEIVKQWADLKEKYDEYFPLYSRFRKYFGYMNTGYNGKKYDIYAYNGGLFKPDEVLDNITIDDDILYEHTLRLSNYDFETDVDVNILGHIFEHSLGEIENVQAEIKGEKIVSQKTKRKKDGIFYTPKYITKYIVENTVGKLCQEKRTELGIVVEEYAKGRKNRKKEIVRTLDKKLDDYRNWLLTLTILDPACGSGAFLNQALEFLINEHRKIDELRGQLLGGAIIFSDITTDILEKNIYGVDLNEESVEIAKLSLWLRTAQKGRKLNTLSNNIKCGNSLIDNPEVAGEKAFNWQNEFPNIFQKKNKKAWHVTTATHNSRYSQRMFDNFVKTDSPVWLSDTEEVIVTETIAEIAKEDKLNILAYNICGDHAHLVLVCKENELPKIVQKIKSVSARACNIAMGRTIPVAGTRGHAPLSGEPDAGSTGEHAPQETRGETQFHLWTQKFGKNEINSDEQLENAIAYIQNNRKKHQLPENKKVQKLAKEMCSSRAYAFRTEYKGGFDVVIGNPPYVQLQSMGEMSDTLAKCNFETYNKSADLYCLFYEKGCQLLKNGGFLGYITPNKWMQVKYGSALRSFLTNKVNPIILVDFPGIQVFTDAVLDPNILVLTKENYKKKTQACVLKNKTEDIEIAFETSKTVVEFSEQNWKIIPNKDNTKLKQMQKNGTPLINLPITINYGIKTGYNDAFFINEATKQKIIELDVNSEEIIKPMLRGRDIAPYGITDHEYLISTFPSLNLDINNYPAVKEHLLSFGHKRLEQTGEKGSRKKTKGKWFETQDTITYHLEFDKPKIIYPNMTSVFPFMYDESGFLGNDKSFILTVQDDSISLLFLTALLNSSLAKLWIWYNCPELGDNRREIRKVYFEHFPVAQANTEQSSILSQLALERAKFTAELQSVKTKFIRSIYRKFEIDKLSNKLNDWHLLSYSEFVKELCKIKIKLSLSDEASWEDYFLAEQKKAISLASEIEKTDKEIDRMVYELYGLTEEEIAIVEDSSK